MIPQLIQIALFVFVLGISLAEHGKEKKANKECFVTTFIAITLQVGLLYWGGFFDELIARLGA